jgi:hypothetical protein
MYNVFFILPKIISFIFKLFFYGLHLGKLPWEELNFVWLLYPQKKIKINLVTGKKVGELVHQRDNDWPLKNILKKK